MGSILVISGSIVKWNLHKRIALGIVRSVGSHPAYIIFGFSVGTGVISMFMSNTTATAMMLPIALALITQLELDHTSGFCKALILSIPFSASIGGIGTLIGGATNVTGVGIIKEMAGIDITFYDWLKIGVPFVVVLLPVLALYLTKYFRIKQEESMDMAVVNEEYEGLGPMSKGEKLTAITFGIIIVLLITRTWWKSYIPNIGDETVTMLGCLIMCVIPVDWKKGEFLLDSKTALANFSLPTVMLIGGSLALGNAMSASGVTAWIADGLDFMSVLPPIALVILMSLLAAIITEFCTNMVVVAAFLPMLYAMSNQLNMNPLLLMVSVTVAASFAFMLPSGTPPTAIAYSTGKIELTDLIKCGFGFKIVCCLLFTVIFYGVTIGIMGLV